jgi:hypothetical protein
MALTAVRCGAQNSVVIGATADITGLEAAGGSIENDPKRRSLGRNPALQQAHDLILANPLSYRPG